MGAALIPVAIGLGTLSAADAAQQNRSLKDSLRSGTEATRQQSNQAVRRLSQEFAAFSGQARASGGERGITGSINRSALASVSRDRTDIENNTNISIAQLTAQAEARGQNPLLTGLMTGLQVFASGSQFGSTPTSTANPGASFVNPFTSSPVNVSGPTAGLFNPLTGVIF